MITIPFLNDTILITNRLFQNAGELQSTTREDAWGIKSPIDKLITFLFLLFNQVLPTTPTLAI